MNKIIQAHPSWFCTLH